MQGVANGLLSSKPKLLVGFSGSPTVTMGKRMFVREVGSTEPTKVAPRGYSSFS